VSSDALAEVELDTLDVQATLSVLGERIGPREAGEIARRLPPELADALRAAEDTEPFDADEFVRRVAVRTGEDVPEAAQTVTEVFGVLEDMLPATELEYMRAALSPDYAVLLDDATPVSA